MKKNLKKKSLVWICCFSMIINLAPIPFNRNDTVMAQEVSKTQSEENRGITISNVRELKDFAENVRNGADYEGAVITLTNDIDFQDADTSFQIGRENKTFRGTFNGEGHSIKGIISSQSRGLFFQNEGEIKNLTLERSSIQYLVGDESTRFNATGGIAAFNFGIIDNCTVTEDVSITASGSIMKRTGGIAGSNNGTIRNCHNAATVTGGDGAIGGITGSQQEHGGIYNSCNTGSVTGTGVGVSLEVKTGGIAGGSDGEIQNCYNTGIISNQCTYGFKGSILASGYDSRVYKCTAAEQENVELIGGCQDSSNDNITKPLEEMKTQEFVTRLNTNRDSEEEWRRWKIYSDFDYPLPEKKYYVRIPQTEGEHGTLSVDQQEVYAGEKVTVSVKPELGYQAEKCQVIQENGTEVSCTKLTEGYGYQFTMPETSVSVKVSYSKTEDVSEYVSGLVLNQSEVQMRPSGTYQIEAKVRFLDQSEESLPVGDCQYKVSKPDIASVSDSGVITAKTFGTTAITVSYKGVSSKCTISVEEPELTISPSERTLQINEEFQMKASLKYTQTETPGGWETDSGNDWEDDWDDEDDYDDGLIPVESGSCSYSGYDDTILSISDTGLVTAIGFGTTDIVVSYLGVSAVCKVTVEAPDIIIDNNIDIGLGERYDIEPQVEYEYGMELDTDIEDFQYSGYDESILSVSDSGEITTNGIGSTTITVTYRNAATAEMKVKVYDKHLILNYSQITIDDSSDFSIQTYISTPSGEQTEVDEYDCEFFGYDKGIISVGYDGDVYVNGYGTTTVTVSYQGFSANCTIIVARPKLSVKEPAKTVRIESNNYGIESRLTYLDGSISSVRAKDCSYSGYDASIIAVSTSGKVTAKGFGTTNVTVNYKGNTAQCSITVERPKALIINQAITLSPGQSFSFVPYFVYTDGSTQSMIDGYFLNHYSQYKVSDSSRLSVSNGQVMAIGSNGGSATLTVTCLGVSASCKVNLNKLSVSRKSKKITLAFGRSYYPSRNIKSNATANYLDSRIRWKTSNKKILTISSSGMIMTKKSGRCTVSGYIGKKKLLSFKVSIPKVRITFKKTRKSIAYDAYTTFSAKAKNIKNKKASSPNIYIKKLTCNKPTVASVNSSGKKVTVHGLKYGTVYIKVTFNNGTKKRLRVHVGKPTVYQLIYQQSAFAELNHIQLDEYGGRSADIRLRNEFLKDITYVQYSVFEYDNRGFRLEENKSSYRVKHNDSISSYSSEDVSVSLFSDTRKVRTCISKVWFSDGTTWTNPVYKKWYNTYKKKYGKD